MSGVDATIRLSNVFNDGAQLLRVVLHHVDNQAQRTRMRGRKAQRNGVERLIAFLKVARMDDEQGDAVCVRLDDRRRNAMHSFHARNDEADIVGGTFQAKRRHRPVQRFSLAPERLKPVD